MDGRATGEVAAASLRLPERQREALELREQEGLRYDEIAARMGTSRDSVAQLIAHARINLYDELQGTVLASVSPSPDCERALSLIAARDDGELDESSSDAAWLEAHLADCDRCRRAIEELGAARAYFRSRGGRGRKPQRRRGALLAGVAALLLLAGIAAAFVPDDPPTESVDPAASAAHGSGGAGPPQGKSAKPKRAKGDSTGKRADGAAKGATEVSGATGEAASSTDAVPIQAAPGAPSGEPAAQSNPPTGNTAVEPTRRTPASEPAAKPKSPPGTAAPTVAAAPTPPPSEPATTEAPPPEEPVDEPPRRREPPGKPDDRPPH